jgi:hypothetical protein
MNELLEKLGSSVSAIPESLPETSQARSLAFLKAADDSRSAGALYTALRSSYGLEALSWEPETIWLTMEKDGIDLSIVNRDKLQAAIALVVNPQFYWDHIVFENTVHAFTGNISNPDVIQECHPAEMAWAVYEADVIRGMDPEGKGDAEFDEDVQQYVAVCLQRAGFICAPEQLQFVDDNLVELQPDDAKKLRKEVQDAWKKVDKGALQRTEFAEDPLGVNLSRLAGTYVYVEDLAKSMGQDFLELKGV